MSKQLEFFTRSRNNDPVFCGFCGSAGSLAVLMDLILRRAQSCSEGAGREEDVAGTLRETLTDADGPAQERKTVRRPMERVLTSCSACRTARVEARPLDAWTGCAPLTRATSWGPTRVSTSSCSTRPSPSKILRGTIRSGDEGRSVVGLRSSCNSGGVGQIDDQGHLMWKR